MHTTTTTTIHALGHVLRPLPGVPGVWASEADPDTCTSASLLERPWYEGAARWRFEVLAHLGRGRDRAVGVGEGATMSQAIEACRLDMRRRFLGALAGFGEAA